MAAVVESRGEFDHSGACRFESRPNCSLPGTSRKLAFWIIATVSLAIAGGFCLVGCWPVMPFAGLEIGVLAWAFDVIRRRESDYEHLVIERDRVSVTTRREGRVEKRELNALWTQVRLDCDRPGTNCRLLIRSQGLDTEVGRHLSDEGRIALAQVLSKRLSG
jgi:uncharacterized membrane protein